MATPILDFTLSGTVEPGKRLGRQLGFPTANVRYDPQSGVWPPDGVYAGTAETGGRVYLTILNQGRHPTAPEGEPTVEAHLLGYEGGALYGTRITLRYLRFLRPERTFSSLEELRRQLERDREAALAMARTHDSL